GGKVRSSIDAGRRGMMRGMLEYLHLLGALLRAAFASRADLIAENLLLRQQLTVLTRPTCKRPRLRARARVFWRVIGICRRYRRRGPSGPSQTWRTFLRNHRPTLWACDLVTVQTLTFETLYVLVFVSHARRELVHLSVTASPMAAWVWRQLIEATPWGCQPRY